MIFDSGVGGLSIYFKLRKFFPFAQYLYVFDNQSFPYGNKQSSYILHRVVNIITAVWNLHKIDIIVIACNTASIVTISTLRLLFFCPIIGIIPPIEYAISLTKNKILGLLATNTTLQSKKIIKLIQKFSPHYTILSLDVTNLIFLVEKRLYHDGISILEIQKFLSPWINNQHTPDTIILGCTHFLLIKKEIQYTFNKVYLVDSSNRIINSIENHLKKNKNLYTYFLDNTKNVAYCSSFKVHIKKFVYVLKQLGFDTLKKIDL